MVGSYLQFASAQQLASEEVLLTDAGRVAVHIKPVGCAITDCILQVRPVPEAAFEDFIGGTSSVNWSATTSPRLRDVSATLPSAIAAGGTAWASVDLSCFYSVRLLLTSGGVGTAVTRVLQR